jgi:oxygen-dependent protoporphyrinogen oxidase
MTLKGGLEQMTERLAEPLDKNRVLLGQSVRTVELSTGGPGGGADSCARRFLVELEGGKKIDADAVILAVPAHVAAGLLPPLDHRLSELLEGIPYSSSMTISMGFDAHGCAALPQGFGFLVPHKENRRMLACTFVHAKFNHRAPEGKAMLRCFLGGARDPEVLRFHDDEVIGMVRKELREILNITAEPLFTRVYRWPDSMAQYHVGHAGRIHGIEERLAELPGLYLAGNAYSGIGISDCIRTGKAAAEKALDYLGLSGKPPSEPAPS